MFFKAYSVLYKVTSTSKPINPYFGLLLPDDKLGPSAPQLHAGAVTVWSCDTIWALVTYVALVVWQRSCFTLHCFVWFAHFCASAALTSVTVVWQQFWYHMMLLW